MSCIAFSLTQIFLKARLVRKCPFIRLLFAMHNFYGILKARKVPEKLFLSCVIQLAIMFSHDILQVCDLFIECYSEDCNAMWNEFMTNRCVYLVSRSTQEIIWNRTLEIPLCDQQEWSELNASSKRCFLKSRRIVFRTSRWYGERTFPMKGDLEAAAVKQFLSGIHFIVPRDFPKGFVSLTHLWIPHC